MIFEPKPLLIILINFFSIFYCNFAQQLLTFAESLIQQFGSMSLKKKELSIKMDPIIEELALLTERKVDEINKDSIHQNSF